MKSPNLLKNIEDLATKTEAGRSRLQAMIKMHEARRKAAA
jgi:hypothetical protein